jgi:hypothetical protein
VLDTPALWEDDTDDGQVVDAQDNAWFEGGTNPVDPVAAGLLDTHTADSVDVDVSGYATMDPGCPPCVPGCQSQQRMLARPGEESADPVRQVPQVVNAAIPLKTALGRPRPNPSTGAVSFDFDVARDGEGAYRLAIYDVAGRRVRTVLESYLRPGTYALRWDGRSEGGAGVAAGIYFVRMDGPAFRATDRILMLE